MDSSKQSQRKDTALRERSFLAHAAHELRTPLHSANGFLEMALEGMAGPLSERQHEMLGYAHLAIAQLGILLEDVLFMARADSGELAPHPARVALAALFARAIETIEDEARAKGVTVTRSIAENPTAIRMDGERVREGLVGLLRGALALTPSGGAMTIAASADDRLLRFSVTLHDVRLDATDLHHLFDRFYQPRPLGAERSAHLGLGLVIAQITAAWHGGCVRANAASDDASLMLIYELPLNGS
jgi:signal transduction histidine kinase